MRLWVYGSLSDFICLWCFSLFALSLNKGFMPLANFVYEMFKWSCAEPRCARVGSMSHSLIAENYFYKWRAPRKINQQKTRSSFIALSYWRWRCWNSHNIGVKSEVFRNLIGRRNILNNRKKRVFAWWVILSTIIRYNSCW